MANKTEALKALEAPCEVKSFELSDLKVTFLNSSAALLTYKAISDATCAGQPVPPTVGQQRLRDAGRKVARSLTSGDTREISHEEHK